MVDFLGLNVNDGSILTAGAISLSAVIAMSIGLRAIYTSKHIARLAKTFAVIHETEETPEFLDKFARVLRLCTEQNSMSRAILNTLPPEDQQALRDLLNHYELIGLGIRMEALDCHLYAESGASTVVNIIAQCRIYINHKRASNDRTYYNLIQIGKRFEEIIEQRNNKTN